MEADAGDKDDERSGNRISSEGLQLCMAEHLDTVVKFGIKCLALNPSFAVEHWECPGFLVCFSLCKTLAIILPAHRVAVDKSHTI